MDDEDLYGGYNDDDSPFNTDVHLLKHNSTLKLKPLKFTFYKEFKL